MSATKEWLLLTSEQRDLHILSAEIERLESVNAELMAALEMVLNHPLSCLSSVTEGAVRAAIAAAKEAAK